MWNAQAEAHVSDGFAMLFAIPDHPRFIFEFAQRYAMRVYYQGQTIVDAELRGTEQAVNRVVACQQAVDTNNVEAYARNFYQGNQYMGRGGFNNGGNNRAAAPGNGVRFGVGNDPWNNVYNPPATFRTTTAVNVRQSPENGSPIITVLPRGDSGLVTRMVKGWYEIADDNGNPVGYVYKKFLTPH